MIPDIPETRVRGRNTASIVNVEATMEIPTSSVPWIAACLGFSPLSKCVVMFSNATMASSTTIPIAMERADIDMIFNVLPVANRYTRDASNEIGMVRTMMSVVSIFLSSFLMPLMTFTVLVPLCFWITICAERLPLVTASCSFSCWPSLTVATSFR